MEDFKMKRTFLFIVAFYLILSSSAFAISDVLYCKVSSLNVRKGPGTNYKIIGKIKKFDGIEVKEESGSWVYFTKNIFPSGGWVSRKYLVANQKAILGQFSPEVEWDEMEQAANNMEKFLFASSPYSKNLISFFDISIKDGHLIMWIKGNMLKVNENTRDKLYRNILDIWRGTKYVRERHYGSWLQVKYDDYMKGKIGTLKTVK